MSCRVIFNIRVGICMFSFGFTGFIFILIQMSPVSDFALLILPFYSSVVRNPVSPIPLVDIMLFTGNAFVRYP